MPLNGNFSPMGDKSISHRIALFAILAHGKCEVSNFSIGEDCLSSLASFEKLGGCVLKSEDPSVITLTGLDGNIKSHGITSIDCGNSGTTIRFLMGILAGLKNGNFILSGDEYLNRRPMERIASPLRSMGAEITTTSDKPPVTICTATLKGIDYTLPVASAQLKSALLLAGLNAEGITRIFEPVPSRNHTELMLKSFGADISCTQQTISILPSSLALPEKFYVPGDPSSAAFFLTAAALIPGSDVTAKGILLNPTRTHFLEILKRMGADITITEQGDMPEPWGDIQVKYNGRLKAADITPVEVPLLVDEIPILALAATLASGKSAFSGLSELRIKETDRLAAIQEELGTYGADITIDTANDTDTLIINGCTELKIPDKEVDSRGDHRMAMTLRLAHLLTGASSKITKEACAAVSYPEFLSDLQRLNTESK